jgi:hypothetical protein
VSSVETEAQACLLAESIRANGGAFSESGLWIMVADDVHRLSERAHMAFERLGADIRSFPVDPLARGFPFAGKVLASAAAEELAVGRTGLLVWLDPDSIIFNEPEPLLLPPAVLLGCRPVDHLLIGSPFDAPIDEFWQAIYSTCQVSEERLFPMTTSADEVAIRPYFNAGMLVVRPEASILRLWRSKFLEALRTRRFNSFFAGEVLYRLFLHQAILAGVILSSLTEQQIKILPHLLNYPLHMHLQYPSQRRPEKLNDLISGRYDTLFHDPAWPNLCPSNEPLKSWLVGQLVTYDLAE